MISNKGSEDFASSLPRRTALAESDKCYKLHRKSAEQAFLIRQELESYSCSLDSLSARMAQTSISFVTKNEFLKTNPKEHLILLKADGSPFDIAEELKVLSSFTEELGCIIGCFSELNAWSAEVKGQIKDSFPSPIYDLSSNLLLVQKLQVLIQEEVTLGFLIGACKSLRKCLDLLESIDYQLMAVDYLGWVVFLPRTLQVISSIICGAASLLSLASESAKSNEVNWQALKSGFMQSASKTSPIGRSKDFLEE